MTEQEFHKRSIKGITLGWICSTAGIIITFTWFASQAYSGVQQMGIELKNQIIISSQDNKQFTKDQVNGLRNEMNAKFDTVKMDQLRSHYETTKQINSSKREHVGLFTEKRTANGIAFVPFK